MDITTETKIHNLLSNYPFLEDFLVQKNPKFKNLKNPLLRNTIGRVATLGKVAGMGGEDVHELIHNIKKEIQAKAKGDFKSFVGRKPVDPEKRERLKEIILALHRGEDVEMLKKQFAELAEEVTATEIADLEQSLIEDGMSEREVRKLCDLHVAIFSESLDGHEPLDMPEGHPVHTYMLENRLAEKIIDDFRVLLNSCGTPPEATLLEVKSADICQRLDKIGQIVTHYTRKENQLFPLLEQHEITGPSQVMWSIHDDIRALLKESKAQYDKGELATMITPLDDALTQISSMIYKEEHILYPMSIDTLSEDDWAKVRHGEEEIGFAWIEPPKSPTTQLSQTAGTLPSGTFSLDTGQMNLEQINLMLTHLPVDISFVDENDRVLYYSDCPDRVFPRSPGVIGRAVQNCHPPDSIGTVNKILEAFRRKEKSKAEFWIELGGKFILIQYFAVFDKKGEYRGCLEASQDITGIRKLEGERRILDWE
jgi:DUF438 domain-containing protein